MMNREIRSKVMTLGNKLSSHMKRNTAFVEAWQIIKTGSIVLPVKGVSFGNRQKALRRLANYSLIRTYLVPEPTNPVDPTAIAVMVMVQGGRGCYRLGYIPASHTGVVQVMGSRVTNFHLVQGDLLGARITIAA